MAVRRAGLPPLRQSQPPAEPPVCHCGVVMAGSHICSRGRVVGAARGPTLTSSGEEIPAPTASLPDRDDDLVAAVGDRSRVPRPRSGDRATSSGPWRDSTKQVAFFCVPTARLGADTPMSRPDRRMLGRPNARRIGPVRDDEWNSRCWPAPVR